MKVLPWLSDRLRLDQATPIPTAVLIVTGGGLLLGVAKLQPDAGDTILWVLFWVVVAACIVLTAYGLLMVASMLVRSGRFARRYGSRIHLQSPIFVTPDTTRTDLETSHGDSESLTGSIRPEGDLRPLFIPGAPRAGLSANEAVRGWERDRERLRRAVDTAVTWLYRRQNWGPGLSHDGRYVEPAPADNWGDQKYEQLGLQGVKYEPPSQVPVEPGWVPPEPAATVPTTVVGRLVIEDPPHGAPAGQVHTVAAVGGTTITCTCGRQFSDEPSFKAHQLAGT